MQFEKFNVYEFQYAGFIYQNGATYFSLNHSNSVFEKPVGSDDKRKKGKKAAAVPATPVINDSNDNDDF